MSSIAAASAIQQSLVKNQVDIAVAKKQLAAAASQGQAVVQLLQAAAAIGKSPGRGGQFDAVG